jgi:hypothetical protein
VESVSLENIACPICFIDWDEPTPDEIDNTQVKSPCCNQIFGRDCYIKALEGDKRCPMCRVGFVIEPSAVKRTRAREAKLRAATAAAAACTLYTVLHTLIDVHRSYVPFWLPGVVGADLRPDISCTSK